jgi:hypothetical protein
VGTQLHTGTLRANSQGTSVMSGQRRMWQVGTQLHTGSTASKRSGNEWPGQGGRRGERVRVNLCTASKQSGNEWPGQERRRSVQIH